MVKNSEAKKDKKELGNNKESKSINTKEKLLDLLKEINTQNEISYDDIEAFSFDLSKDKILKKGLILFLSDQDSLNEYLSLASDLKQAQKEVNEKLLRLAAEFENFRKRTTQEKIQASNYTKEVILKDILNILDSFERANRFFVPTVVQSSKNESQNHIKSNFSKGIEAVFKECDTFLSKNNINQIETKEGDDFNPSIHEAIQVKESDNIKKDKIINIIQNGYRINDKLLRPALVTVSSGGSSS